jgi:hypothetical protein
MMSEEFTESLINIMETLDISKDDINMTQINFDEHWLFILRDIVQPIQQKIYTGYFSDVS